MNDKFRFSYIGIGLAVFSGALFALVAFKFIDLGINAIIAKQLLAEVQIATKKAKAENQIHIEQRRKQQEIIDKNKSIETDRKQNALRLATDTCNFWRQAYKEEQIEYNKLHMEKSCNDVSKFR